MIFVSCYAALAVSIYTHAYICNLDIRECDQLPLYLSPVQRFHCLLELLYDAVGVAAAVVVVVVVVVVVIVVILLLAEEGLAVARETQLEDLVVLLRTDRHSKSCLLLSYVRSYRCTPSSPTRRTWANQAPGMSLAHFGPGLPGPDRSALLGPVLSPWLASRVFGLCYFGLFQPEIAFHKPGCIASLASLFVHAFCSTCSSI
ncbi:unnamed protein product, partial [Protopolystoma xenopodis]